MPEKKQLVINTGPLLALIAATGNLSLLRRLYHEVWIPFEVNNEIEAGGRFDFGKAEFREATWLRFSNKPTRLSLFL